MNLNQRRLSKLPDWYSTTFNQNAEWTWTGDRLMQLNDNLKVTIITAARADVERLDKEYAEAQRRVNQILKEKQEAQRVLDWAQGLQKYIPAIPTVRSASPRNLWFFASRSGNSIGHFIEKFSGGEWSCSCQGFNYRTDCWASRLARQYDNAKSAMNRWYHSYHEFDNRRVPANASAWKA